MPALVRRGSVGLLSLAVVLVGLVLGAGSASAFLPVSPPDLDCGTCSMVTDPAATNGRVGTYEIDEPTFDGNAQRTATWTLLGDGGVAVLGPKPLALPGKNHNVFLFNPTAENGGVAPADGEYMLSVSISYQDGSGSVTRENRIWTRLAKSPPADPVPHIRMLFDEVQPGDSPAYGNVPKMPVTSGLSATVTISRPGGAHVATVTGTPTYNSNIPDEEFSHFSWDGTDDAGKLMPAGRYYARATLTDQWFRRVTTAPRAVWIDHLVTRTRTSRFEGLTPARSRGSVVGDCSEVRAIERGPWHKTLALLSSTECAGSSAHGDRVFQSYAFDRYLSDQHRLLSAKVSVYGKPVKPGMVGGIVYATSLSRDPAWRRFGRLAGGRGWHHAAEFRVPADYFPGSQYFHLRVQARVTGGNRWYLKFWRVTWTYQAWTH